MGDHPILNRKDNEMLTILPMMEEVRECVFSINADSAAWPDGLGALFYQHCWDIIKKEVWEAMIVFFKGATPSKFFTHTCLVVIPKFEHPHQLTNLRPTSLCNMSSKIMAKILNARLALILPRIISNNQSGFMNGRMISENILLAQEIIKDIRKPQKGKNVVMKLDMA